MLVALVSSLALPLEKKIKLREIVAGDDVVELHGTPKSGTTVRRLQRSSQPLWSITPAIH